MGDILHCNKITGSSAFPKMFEVGPQILIAVPSMSEGTYLQKIQGQNLQESPLWSFVLESFWHFNGYCDVRGGK